MEMQKINLPFKVKQAVLAMGSQGKNTLCLARGNAAYLSAVHPDLDNPQDLKNFEQAAKFFLKKHPRVIAYDLHPEYQSTKFIHNLLPTTCRLQPVQHHHAHIASCMAENNLENQKVIGVAFDGTGLGDDGKLWGAEFLLCNYSGYDRGAYLQYAPLIGAEKAIEQPWRVAIFWLYAIYKEKLFDLEIDFVKGIDKKKWQVLKKMLASGFNSPLASSMGRLFDAAASIILNKHNVRFEAEAAIELERQARTYRMSSAAYDFKIIQDHNAYVIDPARIFQGIIRDLKAQEPEEKMAYRFHITIAQMIIKMCSILRKQNRINRVALSGGVFQNKVLLKNCLDLLYREDFRVYTHQKVSCNDSGISLGQAAIANSAR
jgi:hydrogenase maturation protein HypF